MATDEQTTRDNEGDNRDSPPSARPRRLYLAIIGIILIIVAVLRSYGAYVAPVGPRYYDEGVPRAASEIAKRLEDDGLVNNLYYAKFRYEASASRKNRMRRIIPQGIVLSVVGVYLLIKSRRIRHDRKAPRSQTGGQKEASFPASPPTGMQEG